MAGVRKDFTSRIRVFKWKVKHPDKSFNGLFFVRVGGLFAQSAPESDGRKTPGSTVCWFHGDELKVGFRSPRRTRELLLENVFKPSEEEYDSCNINIESVARILAANIHSKFCFSPETLSSDIQDRPKIVLLLDLEFDISKEPSSDSIVPAAAHDMGNHDGNVAASQDEYVLAKLSDRGYKLGVEEIEDMLNRCHRIIVVNEDKPKCLEEVKAGLRVKTFQEKEDDDSEVEVLCPICLETISKGMRVVETHCSHTFHIKCFYMWLPKSRTCPMCRSSLAV